MKTLILDIETSFMLAPVWGLWENNVSYKHILKETEVLCWAAKWLGEKEVLFDSIHQSKPKAMLKAIHALMSEADVIVGFNSVAFDLKHLNAQFLLHGMKPPAAYKNVDLLKVAKSRFKFASNKLDYIAQRLGLGSKLEHEGMGLWIKAMAGNKTAWATFKKYNIQDVRLTEAVYLKMLPWVKSHPNRNLFSEMTCCPSCGSESLQMRGRTVTIVGSYQRFQCMSCGSWSQGTRMIQKSAPVKSAP